MTKIQLILVDDWELRGDGSGNMRRLQFDTLHRLLEIYERNGLRASINAEVMQQLYHLQHGATHRELAVLAGEWEEVVRSAYRRGHDVQLHLHSQWVGATYASGRWTLPSPWSILRHTSGTVRSMIRDGKQYLEELLRSVDPTYRCVSFRSGAWCIAPSDHLLAILADEGLTLDMSIVQGLFYDNEKVQLDYRDCDEPFLPYYPVMSDARRVADGPTRIVSFPTFTFNISTASKLMQMAGAAANKICGRAGVPQVWSTPPNAVAVAGTGGTGTDADVASQSTVWKQPPPRTRSEYLLEETRVIADLSALNWSLMKLMIATIRRHARASGWPVVPVILENHTKDIGDFRPFERFARYVAAEPDLEVLTLRDLHRNLQAGCYRPVIRSTRAAA